MATPEQPIEVLKMTPHEAKEHLRLKEPDSRLNLGVTVFNRETGVGKIIINSLLSLHIQQIIVEQERVQLHMFQEYFKLRPGRLIEEIMPYAHYAGLDAAFLLAQQLDVVDEFLTVRGMGETIESIQSARRP